MGKMRENFQKDAFGGAEPLVSQGAGQFPWGKNRTVLRSKGAEQFA